MTRRRSETAGGLAAGGAVDPAARLRGLGGVPSGGVFDALRARRAADARTISRPPGTRRRSRATSSTPSCWSRMILAAQLVLCTLAAYAFARFEFPGRDMVFALVLVQLMIMPDVLIVENYRTMIAARHPRFDRSPSACPTWPRRSASSCCARPSRPCRRSSTTRRASRAPSPLQVLWKVYVPLARPVYIAYALVSVSYHWNNFLWPHHRHQLGQLAPAHRGAADLLLDRPGHRLVDHHRRDADDQRAAAGRLPAVPAPVRAVVHARGDTLT